jgi:hypothetical protein
MNESENQTPTWKIILIVIFAVFSVARTLHRCSVNQQRNTTEAFAFESNQRVIDYRKTYHTQHQKYVLDFEYYNVFESATKNELAARKWVKVYQDSLIRFDLSGKLKISKNWYFQKPIDEKVRYVLLTPEDIQITVFQFPTKKTLLSNMYYLRLQDFKINGKGSYYQESNEASYSFSYREIPYKGFCIGLKENETMIIFAFESRDHSFKKLEKFAGRFLVNHLVMD